MTVFRSIDWVARIQEVTNSPCAGFKDYIDQNKYSVTRHINAIQADQAVLSNAIQQHAVFAKQFIGLGNPLARVVKENTHEATLNRNKFGELLRESEILHVYDIVHLYKKYVNGSVQIRTHNISLTSKNSDFKIVYPEIHNVNSQDMKFTLAVSGGGEYSDYVVHGLKLCLRFLLIHPATDSNGRVARCLLSFVITELLGLDYIVDLTPFWHLRKAHIDGAILKYLLSGDVEPFCYAVSGSIRDALAS